MQSRPYIIGATLLALSTTPFAADGDASVEQVVVKSVAHFDFGGTSIVPSDRDALMAEVAKQKNVTWQTVTATGYTDSVGSMGYNQRLSERRAQAVKGYLVGKGLTPAMIQTAGKAAADPVAPNDDDAGRARNRRTDIEFHGIRSASK